MTDIKIKQTRRTKIESVLIVHEQLLLKLLREKYPEIPESANIFLNPEYSLESYYDHTFSDLNDKGLKVTWVKEYIETEEK